jgi:hypothetical protein
MALRSRSHHASHRMNVWHRTNVVVYLVIGLLLLVQWLTFWFFG